MTLDELVLELVLDTRKFAEGRRQLDGHMEGIERSAVTTGKAFEDVTRKQIAAFFQALSKLSADTSKQLTGVGNEARRAGASASAGLNAAAVSMERLVGAGLSAYAALSAVKGVMDKLSSTAAGSAATGFAARFAGAPVNWFSALTNAAYVGTGADKNETQGWLVGLRQDIEGVHNGLGVSDRLKALGRLNVSWNQSSDNAIQQVIERLPQVLAQMTSPQAQAWGAQFGSPRLLTEFLRQGQPGVNNSIAAQQAVSVTEQQTKAAQDWEKAVRSVDVAYTGLVTKIQTAVLPAMTAMLEQVDQYLRDLQQAPDRVDNLTASLENMATTAAGGGILGFLKGIFSGKIGIGGAIAGVLRGAGLGFIADLVSSPGASVFPRYGSKTEQEAYLRRKAEETNRIGREQAAGNRGFGLQPGNTADILRDHAALDGPPPATAPAAPPGGSRTLPNATPGTADDVMRQMMRDAGYPEDTIDYIIRGGKTAPDSRLKDPRGKLSGVDPHLTSALRKAVEVLPPGYTAQVISGHDPRATGTPEHPAGHAVDIRLYDSNGRPLPYEAGIGPENPAYNLYRSVGDAFIRASGGQGRWGGYFSRPDMMHYGNLPGMPHGAFAPNYSSLLGPPAGSSSGSTITNNHAHDTDINVGPIHMPPGSDGYAAGSAIGNAISRELNASRANSGLTQ